MHINVNSFIINKVHTSENNEMWCNDHGYAIEAQTTRSSSAHSAYIVYTLQMNEVYNSVYIFNIRCALSV